MVKIQELGKETVRLAFSYRRHTHTPAVVAAFRRCFLSGDPPRSDGHPGQPTRERAPPSLPQTPPTQRQRAEREKQINSPSSNCSLQLRLLWAFVNASVIFYNFLSHKVNIFCSSTLSLLEVNLDFSHITTLNHNYSYVVQDKNVKKVTTDFYSICSQRSSVQNKCECVSIPDVTVLESGFLCCKINKNYYYKEELWPSVVRWWTRVWRSRRPIVARTPSLTPAAEPAWRPETAESVLDSSGSDCPTGRAEIPPRTAASEHTNKSNAHLPTATWSNSDFFRGLHYPWILCVLFHAMFSMCKIIWTLSGQCTGFCNWIVIFRDNEGRGQFILSIFKKGEQLPKLSWFFVLGSYFTFKFGVLIFPTGMTQT